MKRPYLQLSGQPLTYRPRCKEAVQLIAEATSAYGRRVPDRFLFAAVALDAAHRRLVRRRAYARIAIRRLERQQGKVA